MIKLKKVIWTLKKGDEKTILELKEKFFPSLDLFTIPTIETIPLSLTTAQLGQITNHQGIVIVSSKDTVKIIDAQPSLHFIKKLKTFCIGTQTLDLAQNMGFNTHQQSFISNEQLARVINEQNLGQVLITGAKVRASKLEELCDRKHNFTILPLYETTPVRQLKKDIDDITEGSSFLTTFSSPSSVKAFEQIGLGFGENQLAIGPTTGRELIKLGFAPQIADSPSFFKLMELAAEIATSELKNQ